MNNGRKASLVMLHNRGFSVSMIAEKTGVDPREVRKFLSTRYGFPGRITSNRAHAHLLKTGRLEGISDKALVREITLPRCKFLEGSS